MKKVKIVIWLIILGFVGVVIYQNWSYFGTRATPLAINLGFGEYLIPEFPNIVFLLLCFATGLLIAYFHGFVGRFKSDRMIKKLDAATTSQYEEISGLKRELEALQRSATESDPETGETPDIEQSPVDR